MSRYCLLSTPRPAVANLCRFVHRKNSRILPPVSDSGSRLLVFRSEHNDPFLNLAYENWMYENLDLENCDVLLFWQNSPCVVIGRHQNPWLECDLKLLRRHGVKLARRYSGGGAVYHDLGNLNITFLTNRARYDRRRNLESIARALLEGWSIDIEISSRDDLLVDGLFKVSGSAAKLGKYSSYHHCTLLLDSDLEMLNKTLSPSGLVAVTRSTQSTSSHVVNLKDIEMSLDLDELITRVAKAYRQEDVTSEELSFGVLDQYSTEINKIKSNLQLWEWIYGKTSRFTINRSVLLSSVTKTDINLEVTSGIIKNLTLTPGTVSNVGEMLLKEWLIGTQFDSDLIGEAVGKSLESCADLVDNRTEKHLKEIILCILNMS